jgi:Phytanoyl-CoA dioxygenase (PhyH)
MGIPIVAVTGAERASGALGRDTRMAAYKALHEEGVVVLRGVFGPEAIDALYGEFAARYGTLDETGMQAMSEQPPPNPIQKVGDGRYDIAVRMTGAFGRPGLFGNPILLDLLMPLLGGHIMRLGSMNLVASFPGAEMQHIHRDNPHLFEDFPHMGPALPLYAVNVSIPLIDIDKHIGPTAIWPGSHRSPTTQMSPAAMQTIPFQRGDCILMDYRTMHAGLPNVSDIVRPILYLVYGREWFFDDGNHRHRVPLDMPLEDLLALPQELGSLMMRVHQQAARVRQYASA